MKVLLLGARGVLGGAALPALRRAAHLDVQTAGRAGVDVRVDLRDAATWGPLLAADVVVNCADSLAASPELAIGPVLARGGAWVETSADLGLLERLYAARRDQQDGCLVLGLGLSPGLSNLLGAHVAHGAPPRRLEVAVRQSPLSGAGAGSCAWMASLVGSAAAGVRGGARTWAPSGAGPILAFPSGPRATLRLGLPEAVMLGWSTGVADADVYVAPAPAALGWGARLAGALAPSGGRGLRLWRRWIGLGLRALRTRLLRRRVTPVQILALADRPDGAPTGPRAAALVLDDAARAAGYAVAAGVSVLARKGLRRGTWTVDQVLDLPTVLLEIEALAGTGLAFGLDERPEPLVRYPFSMNFTNSG